MAISKVISEQLIFNELHGSSNLPFRAKLYCPVPTLLKELAKYSQQQKGWIVIISDQKINKQALINSEVDMDLVWQLNSALLNKSMISRLQKNISCLLIGDDLQTHPLLDCLISKCHQQNIKFLQVFKEEQSRVKPKNTMDKKSTQLSILNLKNELKEMLSNFEQELILQ